MSKRSIKNYILMYLVIFTFSCVGLTWIKSGEVLGSGDYYEAISTPERLRDKNSVWASDLNTGNTENFFMRYSPFSLLTFVFEWIGLSESVTQRIWVVLAAFLPSVFMFEFLNVFLTKGKRTWVNVSVALFYIFNPITMIYPIFLNVPKITMHILLPLVALLVVKMAEEMDSVKKIYYAIVLILLSLFAAPGFVNIAEVVPLMLIVTFLILYKMIFEKAELNILLYLISVVVGSFILNFWWINTSFYSTFTSRSVLTGGLGEWKMSSVEPFNALRLMGFWALTSSDKGVLYYPFGPEYLTRKYVFLTFVVPLLVFLPIIFYQTTKGRFDGKLKKRVLFAIFLFLVGVFLVKGGSPPLGKWFTFLYESSTLMRIFRETYSKFSLISLFGATLGISASLLYLSRKLKKYLPKEADLILFVVCIFYIQFLVFPIFDGQIIPRGTYKARKQLSVKIPEYWWEASSYINGQDNVNRILVLPKVSYFAKSHLWESGYVGHPEDFFIRKPVTQYSYRPLREGEIYVNKLYENMEKYIDNPAQETRNEIINMVKLLGITHILQMNDIDWISMAGYERWSVNNVNKLINDLFQNDIESTKSYGYFSEEYLMSIPHVKGGEGIIRLSDSPTTQDYISEFSGKSALIFYKLKPDYSQPRIYSPTQIYGTGAALLDSDVLKEGSREDNRVMYVDSEIDQGDTQPIELSYKQITEAKYLVELKGETDKDFRLVFNESFDEGWTLAENCTSFWCFNKVKSTHYTVNDYANGWTVDPGGRIQEFYVYHTLYNRLRFGLAVSTLGFVGAALFTVFIFKRKKVISLLRQVP
ncbi:DUF3367 domain-containing protein [Patescibacteria group bacterium]|nr:DUF3367 domain-containing protein [Patescibacteria group bacterium]